MKQIKKIKNSIIKKKNYTFLIVSCVKFSGSFTSKKYKYTLDFLKSSLNFPIYIKKCNSIEETFKQLTISLNVIIYKIKYFICKQKHIFVKLRKNIFFGSIFFYMNVHYYHCHIINYYLVLHN